MSDTVSDFLLERLASWGIRRIYGYPGDGINGILGALGRHPDLFEFVQVRHEAGNPIKGDPDESGIVKRSVSELLKGVLPRRGE